MGASYSIDSPYFGAASTESYSSSEVLKLLSDNLKPEEYGTVDIICEDLNVEIFSENGGWIVSQDPYTDNGIDIPYESFGFLQNALEYVDSFADGNPIINMNYEDEAKELIDNLRYSVDVDTERYDDLSKKEVLDLVTGINRRYYPSVTVICKWPNLKITYEYSGLSGKYKWRLTPGRRESRDVPYVPSDKFDRLTGAFSFIEKYVKSWLKWKS